jgi:hypothetical protein
MGFNEYCAYLHSRIEIVPTNGLKMLFNYDPHYCGHFARNPSRWTLELSESCLKKLGTKASFSLDGKTELRSLSHKQSFMIPSGIGTRSAQLLPE